jgi:hypothetical protein
MSPNVICSVSLESYHPQKVSKNPKVYCIHNNLPKNAKNHFGSLGPLGVNLFTIGHGPLLWNSTRSIGQNLSYLETSLKLCLQMSHHPSGKVQFTLLG